MLMWEIMTNARNMRRLVSCYGGPERSISCSFRKYKHANLVNMNLNMFLNENKLYYSLKHCD